MAVPLTFTDFHVHLDLVDPETVAAGGLARVLDLGAAGPVAAGAVEVVRAGRMLTAVGGYPSTRPWAAGGLFREVADEVAPSDAHSAVAEQLAAGAAVIKIALNADVGPVWPDDTLAAVVDAAHAAGTKVVAHVEGAGQSARAAAAGVDAFAHAPFTERLDDALLVRLAATTTWISTLRIHSGRDRETAIDNVRRFRAAGGAILYGTDMGNGPASGGVERDELVALVEAGLTHEELVTALTGGSLLPALPVDRTEALAEVERLLYTS
jgi:imidazolonepropionase-like amidohydrolase